MTGHEAAAAAALELLPTVPGTVTGVLHVAAFLGVVYVFRLGGLKFSPGGVELFGRRATPRGVLAGLAVAALLVATARWWAPVAFFLTGWQAFGLVCLEVGYLLQSTARGVSPAAVAMAVLGLVLLVLPWAV